jgi:site-specific DNA-methyltransferase (adenine-specific)
MTKPVRPPESPPQNSQPGEAGIPIIPCLIGDPTLSDRVEPRSDMHLPEIETSPSCGMAKTPENDLLPGFEIPAEETRFELHLGDCIAGMASLPAGSVDVVVTSPPYNLGIDYGTYQDDLSEQTYLDWTRAWVGEVKRVLRDDGALFLNIGASAARPWLPHLVPLALRDTLVLQNTIHWIKSITIESPGGEPQSAGHFKPINSKRFLNDCHEYVYHFTKTGALPVDRIGIGVPYADKSNIARWGHTGGRDKRCRGNAWFVPYETITHRSKERPHPATFPVKLAEYCVRLHGKTPTEMTMLEPFLGIGHAALAAAQLGVRRFIGFEIDEIYLSAACERLAVEPIPVSD